MTSQQPPHESYGSMDPMTAKSLDEEEVFGNPNDTNSFDGLSHGSEQENDSNSENEDDDCAPLRNDSFRGRASSGRAIKSLQVGTLYKKDVWKDKRKDRLAHLRATRSERVVSLSVKEKELSERHSSDPTMKFDNPFMKGRRKSMLLEKPISRRSLVSSASSLSVPSTMEVLQDMVFGSYINLLLLFTPLAIASNYLSWSPTAIFVLNFFAMIPLASMLGDFTEEAAAHTNQTIGGLINASFGNAVEVVVAIQALLSGQYRVVQASMIGSIFSNLLLVLGCCFFFGGLIYDEQQYSQLIVTSNLSLLGLSCIALLLPTPFAEYYNIDNDDVLFISRAAAVFLIVMYLQLLYFQLKTHAKYFEDEEEEETTLPFSVAVIGLLLLTLLIALLSEFLVDSIDGFCEESGISKTFTGLIILPIVGNAVEHMTAVSVAMKNKMDLAMGGKLGSLFGKEKRKSLFCQY